MSMHDHLTVTAAQILQAHEQALKTHPDPAQLQAALDKMLADLNGDWDELARQWTRMNLMDAFREQVRPPTPSEPASPQTQEANKARLRELIEKWPDLARDILGDNI